MTERITVVNASTVSFPALDGETLSVDLHKFAVAGELPWGASTEEIEVAKEILYRKVCAELEFDARPFVGWTVTEDLPRNRRVLVASVVMEEVPEMNTTVVLEL